MLSEAKARKKINRNHNSLNSMKIKSKNGREEPGERKSGLQIQFF